MIYKHSTTSTQPSDAQPVDQPIASPDTPSGATQEEPTMHEQQAKGSTNANTINNGQHKPAHELASHELNRVSLPGDADYDGVVVLRAQYYEHSTMSIVL